MCKWISVEDALPEPNTVILGWFEYQSGNECALARLTVGGSWAIQAMSSYEIFGSVEEKITHWQALPLAPHPHNKIASGELIDAG